MVQLSFQVYLLALHVVLVRGGDPSMQHPINQESPPSIMNRPLFPGDTCNYTASKLQACTYEHCHVDFIKCWDTWQVLDLNCYCMGLGNKFCTKKAPDGLPRTVYNNWVYDSCHDIPGWDGLPSTNDLKLPDSVTILSTDLNSQTPSCIAAQDAAAFQACYVPTSDVTSWISGAKIGSQSYQLDQSCFCKSSAFTDIVMNRSTCAVQSIGYAQALVWMSQYCGTYKDFESQQMPQNWRNLIPIFNATLDAHKSDFHCVPMPNGPSSICQSALDSIDSRCNGSMKCTSTTDCNNPIAAVNKSCFPVYDNNVHGDSDRFRNAWIADSASNICGPDFEKLLSRCDSGTRSVTTTDFTDLAATVNKNCFCSSLNSYDKPDLTWCGGNHLGILKSMQWFERECGNSTSQIPAGLLVPWKEQVRPASFLINVTTNIVVSGNSGCPSSAAKLGVFAINNAIMALLVPIIGRRTLINKISCGFLGRAHTMIWPITGIIGVAFHIGSNAINAKIIQSTPGYEHISITHLILLWCTRPRLAWLVVAFVPFQASKAMYFSVTASILFTECVLQLLGAVFIGAAITYGGHASFYASSLLNRQAGSPGHYARIMYVGGLLDLIAFPFALAACAWTMFGINKHIRSLSSYLLGMEAAARKVCKLAGKSRENISKRLANAEFTYLADQQIVGVTEHYHYVRNQLEQLGRKWLAVQASAMPISNELRSDRRQRAEETRASTYNRRSSSHQEDPDDTWFTDPVRRANESRLQSQSAIEDAATIEDQKAVLIRQMDQNRNNAAQFARREKELRQRLKELNAMNTLSMSPTTRHIGGSLTPWNSGQNPQGLLGLSQLAEQNPTLVQEFANVQRELALLVDTHNQQATLRQAYDEIGALHVELKDAWKLLSKGWEKVSLQRQAELEHGKVRRTLIGIPLVVLSGMLVAWIAQWLWWSGYVNVARDTYCPPRLGSLTVVWTVFSALGAVVGASF